MGIIRMLAVVGGGFWLLDKFVKKSLKKDKQVIILMPADLYSELTQPGRALDTSEVTLIGGERLRPDRLNTDYGTDADASTLTPTPPAHCGRPNIILEPVLNSNNTSPNATPESKTTMPDVQSPEDQAAAVAAANQAEHDSQPGQ